MGPLQTFPISSDQSNSAATIAIAIDFTSANSYLALAPAIELAEELEVEIQLLPFRVLQNSVPDVEDNESDSQHHKRIRAEYRQWETNQYARVRGIELIADPVGIDPTLAHLGLILASDRSLGKEYSQQVFRLFWTKKLDLECEHQLLSVLQSIGIEPHESLHEFRPQLMELRNELLDAEVFAVPTFLVSGERFVGRQHLRIIRRLLTESGQSPI
ncbi:MAG: DsbA family protein [Gammaproteobacteria bacterium]|nr:DsbA family protein [Gammaproteobacteria bacterium]